MSQNAHVARIAAFISALVPALVVVPGTVLALDVISHTPPPYARGVSPATAITVSFDAAVDAATIDGGSVVVLGGLSGLRPTLLTVDGATLTIDPAGDFMSGEMVTVMLTTAIGGGGGGQLSAGYVFCFTIDVSVGALAFEELNRWSTVPAVTPYFLYGGDLDGNGTPDAAAPNEGTHDVSVFLNGGDGVFDTHLEYGVGQVPSSCFGSDFNLDGAIDLATADIASHTMTVLLGNGDGTFAPGTAYPGGTTCRQVYGGDLDGDGDVDLVSTGFASNTVTLHFNHGDGSFSQTVLGPAEGVLDGPFPVFVGDLDLDGLLDLAVGFQGSPQRLKLWINQGGGDFIPGAEVPAGGGAWDLAGNDLDGDGDLDLVMAEAQSNRIHVFVGDGAGGFDADFTFATGSFPLAVHLADLDGDDDPDVITSNFSSRDIRVHENDGGTAFPLAQDLNLIQSGSFAWAHDLDGDGDLDLTSIDELADTIFVHLNTAVTSVASPAAPSLRLSLRPPYPNPASTQVNLRYQISGALEVVSIDVYDASGRLVRALQDRAARGGESVSSGSGRAVWDLRTTGGAPVAEGMYFLRLRGGGEEVGTRVLVVR